MDFSDKLFGTMPTEKAVQTSVKKGKVSAARIGISASNYENICKCFIAFDTETTGLSYDNDRIVELGAVLFQDGKKVSQFGSLVNPGRTISPQASAVNHITNSMLKSAPKETQVYQDFAIYFESALKGDVVVCAHNAAFDMNFLTRTLERLGYSGTIKYVDTLSLSKKLIKGLENYKQPTVAKHFGIINTAEHRAVTDAEVCGTILNSLLALSKDEMDAENR